MLADIHALAATLEASIGRYQRILDFLQYMSVEMEKASEVGLQGMAEKLSELQEQASELDSSFQSKLNRELVLCQDLRPLFSRRETVIREILLKNSEVSRKAQSAQSFLAHELGTLRHGQKAMSGYKPQQERRGRIVNSSS